ncbi:DUF2177 family protein [Chthonobacter rhizosphaerae]|uniref:DUF2177 family protein n=1 Tax=Chthonobacter rhizosphaerae TaxID=2735553 RepID=UPI0015EEAA44|nr:DUF2177 family protein [Chthonobacter rhizosphaerae]
MILIGYLAAAAVFLAVDALWLGRVARGFYAAEYGDLLRPKPRLGAAAAFYLAYLAGLAYFAVAPSLDGDAWDAAIDGGLYGLACYGTYHLTNLATLKRWPMRLLAVDMGWGAGLSAVSAVAGRAAALSVG